jgi:hypothetical protein
MLKRTFLVNDGSSPSPSPDAAHPAAKGGTSLWLPGTPVG